MCYLMECVRIEGGGGWGGMERGEGEGVSRSCLLKQDPDLATVALLSPYGRYQYIQKRI